jgi:hypothetical protein
VSGGGWGFFEFADRTWGRDYGLRDLPILVHFGAGGQRLAYWTRREDYNPGFYFSNLARHPDGRLYTATDCGYDYDDGQLVLRGPGRFLFRFDAELQAPEVAQFGFGLAGRRASTNQFVHSYWHPAYFSGYGAFAPYVGYQMGDDHLGYGMSMLTRRSAITPLSDGSFCISDWMGSAEQLGAHQLAGRGSFVAHVQPNGHVVRVQQTDALIMGQAADRLDNVFLGGMMTGQSWFGSTNVSSAFSTDAFVAQWSTNGHYRWVKPLGGGNAATVTAVAAGPDGTVWVGGGFSGSINTDFGPRNSIGPHDVLIGRLTFPRIQVGGATLFEGDSGSTNVLLTLTLSEASAAPVKVDFHLVGGTATAEDGDFVATNGTAIFPPGETILTLPVTVLGDLRAEEDEFFFVEFDRPVYGSLVTNRATVTILNDDIEILIGNIAVHEGDSGTVNAVFTVTIPANPQPVSVNYATSDRTAQAGVDYQAVSGTLQFAPGETQRTITVPVIGDRLDEDDETFVVTLSNPVGARLGTAEGTGTILDDDTALLFVTRAMLFEGHSGTRNAVFEVGMNLPRSVTVTVDFSTADGTAVAGRDYQAVQITLVFPPGTTNLTVLVPVIGDVVDEPDEVFYVRLSNAVNAPILVAQETATILDDDPPPVLTVANITVLEGDSGFTEAVFTLELSTESERTAQVTYATTPGSASAGADFTPVTGTVTFAPGVTRQTVRVNVLGDLLNEEDETFFLTLGTATALTLGATQIMATITDNDPLPSLAIASQSLSEGSGGITGALLSVTLSAASGRTVSVRYETLDDTAVAPGDYTAAQGLLVFPPGETSRPVTVTIQGDLTDEPDEAFLVRLRNATNAVLSVSEATITILDDDAPPEISALDTAVVEGHSGTTNLVFSVVLSAASAKPVTVDFATTDGSAQAPGDYAAQAGTLDFPPGTTVRTVTVPVSGDSTPEPDESFLLRLSNPVNTTLARAEAAGWITNDDGLSIADASAVEGDGGSVTMSFLVSLSSPAAQTVSVDYASFDATATAPGDYTAVSGTLTFTPGTLSQTIEVTVSGDTLAEPTETFTVQLYNAVNALLVRATATGTIVNDDDLPVLTVADTAVVEGDSGARDASFTLTLTPVSGQVVTVVYSTAPETAVAGEDYQTTGGLVTFPPGVTSRTVNIPVLGDVKDEADETFLLRLTNPGNALLGNSQARGTILDDDDPPMLSIDDVTVVELDNNAGANALFTASLSAVSGLTVTVAYATADGSATAGADYAARTGTLTFPPGSTRQTLQIPVLGDAEVEPYEHYFVRLSSPANATLARAEGIGTIGGLLPSITGYSPASGPVGTAVTIHGHNLSSIPASNFVFFGGVRAAVTGASTNALSVTVPAGATHAPLSVTIGGRTVFAPFPYPVTFASRHQIDVSAYTRRPDLAAAAGPRGVAVADLDGDGRLDVLVAARDANVLSAYRNLSQPGVTQFASRQDLATGAGPFGVAIADLDGDGRLDVVTANYIGNNLSIFRNVSTVAGILFAARVDLAVGQKPRALALADLDGDGKIDITSANEEGTVSVIRNRSTPGILGSGTFDARVDLVAGAGPASVAAGDLDGDGRPELVIANSFNATGGNSFSVLRNLSRRGTLDANSFATRVNVGTGSQPLGLALADLDADGKTDVLVVHSGNSTLGVYRNTNSVGTVDFGWRTDFACGSTARLCAVADLDGDARPDVLVANEALSVVAMLENIGAPGVVDFAPRVSHAVITSPFSVAVGDMDNDGRPDLLAAGLAGSVSLSRNVMRLDPVLQWPPAADIGYGTPLGPEQLRATANLPGTFAYIPASGTIMNAGTNQLLTAVFLPNDAINYNSATSSIPITVHPAPLSVTVTDAARPYGVANPPFTGQFSGVRANDQFGETFVTTATEASPPGEYPVTVSFADPHDRLRNYIVSIQPGVLTVGPGLLAFHGRHASRRYGEPNPLFSGTMIGARPADGIGVVFQTTATPASPAGAYPVFPVLSDPNGRLDYYLATTNPGVFVITADDAPVLNLNPQPLTYLEDSGAVPLDGQVQLVDGGSVDFEGGTLRVEIVAGALATDRLALRHVGNAPGQIGVDGNVVTFGGTTVGSIAGSGTASLLLSFNAAATRAVVETILRHVTFEVISDAPKATPRTVRFILTDGDGGVSRWVFRQVNVTPVNDIPSVNLTFPVDGTRFRAPATIPLEAAASDVDGRVTRVSFFSGTNLLGVISSLPYRIPWDNVPVGEYEIFAVALDDEGATNRSAAITVSVHPAITRALVSQGGQFEILVIGAMGATYDIEISSDLVRWTKIGEVTTGPAGTPFLDPEQVRQVGHRFYRFRPKVTSP